MMKRLPVSPSQPSPPALPRHAPERHLGRALRYLTLLLLILPACVVGMDEDGSFGQDSYEETELGPFNRARALEDAILVDWTAMNESEIQAFLESTPYDRPSVLANHVSQQKSAARAIADAAKLHKLNPLIILTRLQLEQSLIGRTSASGATLDWAMGCGCPDYQDCNEAYRGFDAQVSCMAKSFRSYLDDLQTLGKTIANWRVGVTKKTLDGYHVKPQNKATAALYTYTPWVHSAKLHHQILGLFASHIGYFDEPLSPVVPTDPENPSTTQWVIDAEHYGNSSDTEFRASSSWIKSTSVGGYLGSGYRYRKTAESGDVAEFRLTLDEPKTVHVETWWTAGFDRATDTPHSIYDGQGKLLQTIAIDQSETGGRWVSLGNFAFTAGTNVVSISPWTSTNNVVIADAVRITAAQ